ncbi:hypothetical protein VTI74DRAFT_4064 [Chaetomium olivicolor]
MIEELMQRLCDFGDCVAWSAAIEPRPLHCCLLFGRRLFSFPLPHFPSALAGRLWLCCLDCRLFPLLPGVRRAVLILKASISVFVMGEQRLSCDSNSTGEQATQSSIYARLRAEELRLVVLPRAHSLEDPLEAELLTVKWGPFSIIRGTVLCLGRPNNPAEHSRLNRKWTS